MLHLTRRIQMFVLPPSKSVSILSPSCGSQTLPSHQILGKNMTENMSYFLISTLLKNIDSVQCFAPIKMSETTSSSFYILWSLLQLWPTLLPWICASKLVPFKGGIRLLSFWFLPMDLESHVTNLHCTMTLSFYYSTHWFFPSPWRQIFLVVECFPN